MRGMLFRLFLILLLPGAQAANPASAPQTEATVPFRTDVANQDRPWYRLKPGEFPPYRSEHRVGGELVEADYIHRSGVFRRDGSGELVNFTLPPYGSVSYLNAEADLRDVPLGTHLLFCLYQDDRGAFTRAVRMEDEFTQNASQGFRYRLDAPVGKAGKLSVIRHRARSNAPGAARQESLKASSAESRDESREEIPVEDGTRVWKGGKQGTLSDLAAGDDLLFNVTGGSPQSPRRCTEIWIGDATQRATEQQRRRHFAFLKARGVPAWIDRVEGDRLTVTLFSSEPDSLQALFKAEGIDPALWAKEHRRISVAVANEHLRTYNPPVDNKWATVQEFQSLPTAGYGCSGVRWVIQPELMLEGFRKGRIVRLFAHASWPIEPMPFGEGLHAGGHDEEPADAKELQSADFPYRTDFGNEDLPWYQLQPGTMPPDHSEHRVGGELVKVDAAHRAGQFRVDRTGERVDFTLPTVASIRYLNAEAALEDLPLGMRCLFFLYQDSKGAFTRAAVIMDEYSYLASNTLTYRLEALQSKAGRLMVARHAAPVQVDYILEPRVAPDFGRLELEVDERTRVWKGDRQIPLSDLVPGDELLVNLSARTTTSRGRCTDIWVGAETHRLATEQQRKRHTARVK